MNTFTNNSLEMNDSLLFNDTQNGYIQEDYENNVGSALTTSFLLCITALVGILSNASGLHILLKKHWRNHVALIQLLIVSSVVCGILAPLQVIRTGLSFTGYQYIQLCQVQHFIHLHVDCCTFVTLLVITHERLVRIFRNSPSKFKQTSRKVITCSSWILILPVVIFIIYTDNETPGTISFFSFDCLNHRISGTLRHTVEYVTSVLFLVVLAAITAMYLIAVCRLHKKMSTRVGSMYPNIVTDMSQPNTPYRVLQPREATPARNSLMSAVNWFEYPAGRQSVLRRQSMTNLYNSPSTDTETVESNRYNNVLNEFKHQFIEIQPNNSKPETRLNNNDKLLKLRKLSETYQNQSRQMAKSSIAKALGKMTTISLFSFDQEVKNRCDMTLNPLKHTRRSAGNVWQEETLSSNNLKPQNIIKKKKLPRKVIPKLKKQNSVDSIGTFSDTSGIVDCRTDSDISSITFNTESNYSYDGSSIISVIIEQPEPESGISRQPSTEKKPIFVESTARNLFLDSVPRADSPMRPRCHSTSLRPSRDEVEGFRQRAYTEGSNVKPDRTKIKKILKKRGKRHKKNKKLPPLQNLTPNVLSLGRFYSSTDYSCSDSCQENDRPLPVFPTKTPSECDSYLQGSSLMSDSCIDLQSTCSVPNTINSKQADSTTQTEVKGHKSSENVKECPEICITEDMSDSTMSPVKVKQNNWLGVQNSPVIRNQQQKNKTVRPKNSSIQQEDTTTNQPRSPSMTNLRNINGGKSDTRQTVKRSIMIILSLAISYLPTCITVFLLDSISTDNGIFFLQITRTIQYLYFSIIPTIYVHTNQGLQKTINRPRRS